MRAHHAEGGQMTDKGKQGQANRRFLAQSSASVRVHQRQDSGVFLIFSHMAIESSCGRFTTTLEETVEFQLRALVLFLYICYGLVCTFPPVAAYFPPWLSVVVAFQQYAGKRWTGADHCGREPEGRGDITSESKLTALQKTD